MSRQRLAITAVAGVSLIGAAVYSTRKSEITIDNVEKRRIAQEQHELELRRAGNGIAKGTDNASGSDKDAQRRQANTAGKESPEKPNN